MIEYNAERVREAVQYLVDSSYFLHHTKKLRSTVKKKRSMPFKDDAECLNELLVVGRQSEAAMEALIEVAAFKRPGRNDYQREFMAAKRRRDRKVLELEEALVGRPLGLDERNSVLLRQYDIWNKEKGELLGKLGDAEWNERNSAIREFWVAKEKEIDALTEEAKRSIQKTVQRKRVVVVEPQPVGQLGNKLKEALKDRLQVSHRAGRLSLDKTR
jgi:sporulation protein YlmC with PRC-barrel domain